MPNTAAVVDMTYQLKDRYKRHRGRVFLTGPQALVRLPLMQKWLDEDAGFNTAGFISGYRGSPLGAYDTALWAAKNELQSNHIVFQPGVNEELAATAVAGTQQLGLDPKARHDGVFGIWYGKGPGVDRASDALKHGNAFGTTPHGGVLVIAGDDHGAVSSSFAHQSDHIMSSWRMPILHPADVSEYLSFGLLGIALSRYSGCWVGFKAISEVVESGMTVDLEQVEPTITLPTDFIPPAGGIHYRWPDPFKNIEARWAKKIEAVEAFARVNRFNRMVWDTPNAKHGIATTGKTYHDVIEALRLLGINKSRAETLGLRLYKVGLVWPLERSGCDTFANGLEDIFVIEEKRPVIEPQLLAQLYNRSSEHRPRIIGKRDLNGQPLIPEIGETRPLEIAKTLAQWLGLPIPHETKPCATVDSSAITRTPYFCSGCPHNTSTKVPAGSTAYSGVGCHFMAIAMNRDTITVTQMGGEGVNWIGQAPFTDTKHVFQNLGDGTFYHSGLLAIRQSVAANSNITYKILFNDAVAMTGGQPVDGPLSPWAVSQQIYHEGVKTVAVVSDEPNKYPNRQLFAPGTTFHHRSEMDAVQRRLRDTTGVSALIYDQTCAAEKRRRRKRNRFPDPQKRTFINTAVCEGCGDCSEQSNCVSLHPVETTYGRKRQVDQSSCNKDFTCIDGFCPSFVTIEGGRLKSSGSEDFDSLNVALEALPLPAVPQEQIYNLLVTGVGGTGVVTIGALITMAAHLEGKSASVLDFTGFAQKGGAVVSHIRLAPSNEQLGAARIPDGMAHALIAADLVVATGAETQSKVIEETLRVVANTHVLPTGAFALNPDLDVQSSQLLTTLEHNSTKGSFGKINAHDLANRWFGDAIAANVILFGFAYQSGLIPLSLESIERAIQLNGVAVDSNRRAFALGRLATIDPSHLAAKTVTEIEPQGSQLLKTLSKELERYQNGFYGARFLAALDPVSKTEKCIDPLSFALTKTAARSLFKLMAYKDEYEVARLYSGLKFRSQLGDIFEGDYRVRVHLAPPFLPGRDEKGRPKKRAFGAWIFPIFEVLAKLRFLRGTPLDPFGHTAERRTERRLIESFIEVLAILAKGLELNTLPLALEIAALPLKVRGFGPVKAKAVETYENRLAELLIEFNAPKAPQNPRLAAE